MQDWSQGNDPSLFIQKVKRTGEPVEAKVTPEELLVDYYRSRTWKDTVAEAIAAGAVQVTGASEWGKAVVVGAKRLGAYRSKEAHFAFKALPFTPGEENRIHFELKQQAVAKLAAVSPGGKPALQLLMTGATGFIGMDLLGVLAGDPGVQKVYCIVWHKEMGAQTPSQFKDYLMGLVGVTDPAQAAKFEVLPGDVTLPNMGLSEGDLQRVQEKITHLIHLAASVSFDDPYEKMFTANVTATQMVLQFAHQLQNLPKSSFVNFISTETCYIHGRNVESCREDELHFPRDYYNNHYELTKALGDLYCRHFTLENRLRVISLCPAITVGDYHTGNNHGDTKVINAATNAFGRIGKEMEEQSWAVRAVVNRILSFPGLADARLNLVSVDRVTAGLHSAMTKPLATGERIHLGGEGLLVRQLMTIFKDDMGLTIRLVNPVFHRLFSRPVLRLMCKLVGMQATFARLEGLFNIFASYAEWGQPVHELGNDVRFLNLPLPRPDMTNLACILTRHNHHVQQWGKIRDKVEVMERERKWAAFLADVERRLEVHPGVLSPQKFEEELKRLKF